MTASTHHFTLKNAAYPDEDLRVVSFTGSEALSRTYRFEIVFCADRGDLDFEKVIEKPATLTIAARLGKIERHGIPVAFEQMHAALGQTFYRLELVPRLAMLAQTEHSRVFLGKNVQQVVAEVLTDAGLAAGPDFEFRLSRDLDAREYVVQYQETDYAFLSRWLEREGITFFFEHAGDREKCVFTDFRQAHGPQAVTDSLRYAPRTGLEQDASDAAVSEFFVIERPLPKSVLLKDWNYRTPGVELEAEAAVIESGFGRFYGYGEHFKTLAEGRALAKIRAEAELCRQTTCSGRSFSPYLDPGFTFRLEQHYRKDVNQDYLTVEVTRHGRQLVAGTVGLGGDEPEEDKDYYRTTFSAIPARVQFRPERATPWPRVSGVVNAVVDGPSSGQHPDIDDAGRYKVIAAFDRSGRTDGKASPWIRMAQPYGGSDHGLHFPLHKGAEVLLGHVNADPDRPIIMAAVPNPENPSPVDRDNQTKCRLTTSSGNELHFEDLSGSERVLFHVPNASAYLRMGAPNDPADSLVTDIYDAIKPFFESSNWTPIDPNDPGSKGNYPDEGRHGWKYNSPDWITVIAGAQLQLFMIAYQNSVLGLQQDTIVISKTETLFGFVQRITGRKTKLLGSENEIGVLANLFHAQKSDVAANKTHLTDSLIDTTGQVSALNGEVSSLGTSIDTLSGQVNEMAATVERLAQERADLIGVSEVLAQQRSDLIQNNTKLAGQVSALAQSHIDLHAEVNELAGQVTELGQQVTELSAQATTTATQITRTALTMTHLNGMDLTI